MVKLSGLQLDVLKLYRSLLRSARKKSALNSDLYNFVCHEFRDKARSVGRLEFIKIEHMIRQGYKQKKLMEMPGFNTAQSFSKSSDKL
eukprot:gene37011-44910_t